MSSEDFQQEPDSTFNIDCISISSRSCSKFNSVGRKSPPIKKKFKTCHRYSRSSSTKSFKGTSYNNSCNHSPEKANLIPVRSTHKTMQNRKSRADYSGSLSYSRANFSSISISRSKTKRSYLNAKGKSDSITQSSYKRSHLRSVSNFSKTSSTSSRSSFNKHHYTRSNTGIFVTNSHDGSNSLRCQSKSGSMDTLSQISRSYRSVKMESGSPRSLSYSRSYTRNSKYCKKSNDGYYKSYSRTTSSRYYGLKRDKHSYSQSPDRCSYDKFYKNYRRSSSRSYRKSRSPSLHLHSRYQNRDPELNFKYDYKVPSYKRNMSKRFYDRYDRDSRGRDPYQNAKPAMREHWSSSNSYDYNIMISYKKRRVQKPKYSKIRERYYKQKRNRSPSDSYNNSKIFRHNSYARKAENKYSSKRSWMQKLECASKYAATSRYTIKDNRKNQYDNYSHSSKERSYYKWMYPPVTQYKRQDDYYGDRPSYYNKRRRSPSYCDYHESDRERERHPRGYVSKTNYSRYKRDKSYSLFKEPAYKKKRKRSSSCSSDDSSSSSGSRLPDYSNVGGKNTDVEIKQGVRNTKDGHLLYKPGDLLLDKYKIISTLGEGTFGKVVEATDSTRSGKRVAIKIIHNVSKYREAAELEVDVLEKLAEKDLANNSLCVKLLSAFDFHGHACLSFDILGQSVFDFLKTNNYQPYTLTQISHISYQLCHAVKFLHDHQLTHTDLKPENILFVNSDFDSIVHPSTMKEYRNIRNTDIRLIDFGSATFDHEHHTKIVSTRQYRALEVILELGWDHPCDVWSIGCILFELYTGHTLFQTHSNIEHLAMIEKILGNLPSRMCKKSKKQKYFSSGHLDWDKGSRDGRYVENNCFFLNMYLSKAANNEDENLFDLINRMLEFDPKERIDLKAAKRHSFHNNLCQLEDL